MRDITTLSLALLATMSVGAYGQEQPTEDEPVSPLDQTVPVAEEDVSELPADTLSEQITEDDMLREFGRFRQLLAEQNYDEADVSAKRVVEMTIKVYGPRSRETAKALNNLAIVQHNNSQFSAAVQNFTSAIEILEVVEDRLDDELVNPLRGLGAAHLGDGRPDLAMNAFGRATHITHVNEGPHNIEQVEILESLAEAKVRLGDVSGARDTLNRIHALNVRHFRNDALGLLPSLLRRAEWQHRAGYYNDERVTYRRAIRIIESSVGKNDPRLVQPLLLLGQSFYYYDPNTDGSRTMLATTGETYFKRAVRIAEATEDYPWLELAMARLALADFYLSNETHNRARKIYLEVWKELSRDEERIEMRQELLGQPIAIREESLPRYAGGGGERPTAGLLSGSVGVDYTVSTRGRVRNIRSEVKPAEFNDMLRVVHREIRRRIFRPGLVDGVPVESGNQVFKHDFFYTKAELDSLIRKRSETEQKDDQRK